MFGVWEDGKFIGAVVYGRGSNSNIGKQIHLTQTQICELVRVALRPHTTPVSRIIAITIQFMKKSNVGLQAIVSYADDGQGHIGTIYQAGNWLYTGIGKGTPQYFYKGRWCHHRMLTHLFKPKDIPYPSRPGRDKFRYYYPLNEDIRQKIKPFVLPYPKRAHSVEEHAAPSRVEATVQL